MTPRLYGSFGAVRPVFGTVLEAEVLARLYNDLPNSSFSDDVLQRCPTNLLVMPMRDVQWCDLGEEERVMQVVRQTGVSPQWIAA
ncbi:MAG: hypothetical protein ACREQR_04770 [Candidatus Binataceae bacterium]